jgi:tRNA A37 methylthiotransferase MiaB
MAEQVRPEAKKRRSEELRAVCEEAAHGFRRRFMGTTLSVLWEEERPASGAGRRWTGLTGNYLRVGTEAASADLLGRLEPVRLTALENGSLVGDRAESPC